MALVGLVVNIERGVVERIDSRGRVFLRLPDRIVVAEINNGSGGCAGDRIEGDMRPGLRSWRNIGNGILSVVRVLAAQPSASDDGANGDDAIPLDAPDQNNRRRLS
jgi:hypothetical protein